MNIIESVNTSIEIFGEAENLDPKQKTACEKLVDCLADFLDIRAVAGNPCEVTRPEPARIPQPISDVGYPACSKIVDFAERDVIAQFTYIPLQPPLHHVEA